LNPPIWQTIATNQFGIDGKFQVLDTKRIIQSDSIEARRLIEPASTKLPADDCLSLCSNFSCV
jgi:hypothetical protein